MDKLLSPSSMKPQIVFPLVCTHGQRGGVFLGSSKESIVYAYGGKGIPTPSFDFLREILQVEIRRAGVVDLYRIKR